MNIKEKFTDLLGGLGGILYFIFSFLLPLFPIVMIVNSFDLPIWTNFIMIAMLFLIPTFSSFCFWIIGFIGVILGPQDVIAIVYYVLFAINFVPPTITIICNLIAQEKD